MWHCFILQFVQYIKKKKSLSRKDTGMFVKPKPDLNHIRAQNKGLKKQFDFVNVRPNRAADTDSASATK